MIKFLRRIIISYKEYIVLIILSIVSLSILSYNNDPHVKKLRTVALGAFSVFNEMLSSVTNVFYKGESIEQLKKENAELMLELNLLRKQGQENRDLRSMLGYKDTAKSPLVPSKVISKLVNKIAGNVVINLGLSDGLKVGMPVITQVGLVGIVSEVSDDYAVVKTLYNSSLNIAVTVENINVDGILSWDGHELIVKNVPAVYDIKIGDRVESSDFSSLFPPSIPIGTISQREETNSGLLHILFVKPYADIYSIHDVFVIKVVPSKQINKLEMNLMK